MSGDTAKSRVLDCKPSQSYYRHSQTYRPGKRGTCNDEQTNIYILTHIHKKTPTNLNVHRKDRMPDIALMYREVFCRVGESHLVDFE